MKNKALIITNIIILSCLAIGLLLFMFWGIGTKHNFFSFKNELLESETYNLSDINGTKIDLKSYDIEFRESIDDTIKVEVYGSKKSKDNIKLNNDNNKINLTETGSTFCFGFCFAENDIVIYIPNNYQGDMNITTVSGDIEVLVNLLSDDVDIKSTSGDITLHNLNDGKITSTSGDIEINEAQNLELSTVSGDIDIEKANSINAKSTSGEINIREVSNNVHLKTTSGDITAKNFMIYNNSDIESVSGEIEVRLINEAKINAETKSGDKDIKSSNGEYLLNLKTVSGDITIK